MPGTNIVWIPKKPLNTFLNDRIFSTMDVNVIPGTAAEKTAEGERAAEQEEKTETEETVEATEEE